MPLSDPSLLQQAFINPRFMSLLMADLYNQYLKQPHPLSASPAFHLNGV
jgi:hypothetical protein